MAKNLVDLILLLPLLFPEKLIFDLMNFHDLFLKPYESYENYQIALEAIATIFGLLSVFFSIKKIFGSIRLGLFQRYFMCIFSLNSDFSAT